MTEDSAASGELIAGDRLIGIAQLGTHFFRLHHGGAAFRKRRLFAGLGRELGQFRMGMAQIIRLAADFLESGLLVGKFGLGGTQRRMRLAHRRAFGKEPAIGIDELAMHTWVERGRDRHAGHEFRRGRGRCRARPGRSPADH